jgi:hypothetical protein
MFSIRHIVPALALAGSVIGECSLRQEKEKTTNLTMISTMW